MYEIQYGKQAVRSLARMQRQIAGRIRAKRLDVATSPYDEHRNVARLRGRNGYRVRIGDWRALYEVDDDTKVIRVVNVSPRGSAYRESP